MHFFFCILSTSFTSRHSYNTSTESKRRNAELTSGCTLCFVRQAKAGGKKALKVALKISPQGIVLQDSSTGKLLENVSIYRHVRSQRFSFILPGKGCARSCDVVNPSPPLDLLAAAGYPTAQWTSCTTRCLPTSPRTR